MNSNFPINLAHLIVCQDATGNSPTDTVAQLSDAVFGTSGDTVNLASQYNDCSHGQLTFQPATGTGITDGAIEVTVTGAKSVGEDTLMNQAITSLTSSLGGSPSSLFNFVMFCMPVSFIKTFFITIS